MSENQRQAIHLKDYKKPDYKITDVELDFDLYEEKTIVKSRLTVIKECTGKPLRLNGENLKLIGVKLEGEALSEDDYALNETHLEFPELSDQTVLEIETEIKPQDNHALEGLYKTGDIFCTQNESEGFRKITYYLDRPDNLAKFKTTIRADKKKYPVLLSNGNPIDQGDLDEGRHFVTWEDPFFKPCYLFALVAGDLAEIKDTFVTCSGRTLDLRIYVEHGNEDKTDHAMRSLKNAMKWDEETFGLECDLNTYMIVAVDDFNFGAMENKGLNIFNSQYILANPQTATDRDYENIESVIGHEYFHNWTGNRVTCRDWFQITLKEGLTVFRDQEFSADMSARSVKRISDVRILRDYQFVEDAGPNAHSIRPSSYIEINNFYTATVYNKGTEVIRMIQTLIGKEAFCKGITKYFELYDGQAVTTEDFVHAMEVASGLDLTQFKNWYENAGTPICQVRSDYDINAKVLKLHVTQKPPKIDKEGKTPPYYFPLSVGLIDESGKDISLDCTEQPDQSKSGTQALHISEADQSFEFKNVNSKPIPSLLRNFSAPIYLDYDYSDEDLVFLLASDSDDFNRYEAGQRLSTIYLEKLIQSYQNKESLSVPDSILSAFGKLIEDSQVDLAFKAEALILPSESFLIERMSVCDFEAAFHAREWFVKAIAEKFENKFIEIYQKHQGGAEFSVEPHAMAERAIKNRCLAYLVALNKSEHLSLAKAQFDQATNMTDEIAALSLLAQTDSPEKKAVVQAFYDKWKSNTLVMNKWLITQASSKVEQVLEDIKRLSQDPVFDIKNPNKVRALFGVFAQNFIRFHDASGQGYAYISDRILEIDQFNPKAAAGLAKSFGKYSKLDETRKGLMGESLEKILSKAELSTDVYEIVSNILGKKSVAAS